jgi:stage II sporulation protein AA (anti-sigma F factor antagonist)
MMIGFGMEPDGALVLIQAYDRQGVCVIRLQGRLDSQTAPGATAEVEQLLATGTTRVLVNLAELEFMSSAGLRVLVQLARELRARQGLIKLCAATEPIRKLLELAGLISLLELHDVEANALMSF